MKYTDDYLKDLEIIQDCIPGLEELRGAVILVTGAGGLIGSAVADFLLCLNDTMDFGIRVQAAARNEVKIKERFGARADREDFIYVKYDALDPIVADPLPDYIIHAASPANPALYTSSPVETMLANFTGMRNALEFARENGVKRVLYVSSSEVYGKKEDTGAYKEEDYSFLDILNPRACYPSSKRAAETLCASYLKEYGVDSVIVRPGHVYGGSATASDNRASSQFIRDAASGADIVMKSAGTQMRSYCYVCDAVSSIITVLLKGSAGSAYNISNPESVCTIRAMAERIAKEAGVELRFEVPTDAEKSGYNLMDNSSLDSGKIEALGWKGRFSLEQGIRHSLEMMK